jgi:NAD(P)-dependent dehydrogenase (short-subunit alcohol dehydrogenase family)
VPDVSIVSGAGRGIGRAVAVALGAAGHAVGVNDTGVALDGTAADPEPAKRCAGEIQAAGGRALAIAVDARTPERAEQVVGQVAEWAGEPPTVLVHAAGTLRDAMAHKAAAHDWAEVLASHLTVGLELTRALVPAVRARGYGRIVYLGGAAGLVGSVGQAAYAAAKAGLFGLTRALALEMGGRDVCVNYVAPFAFTRMTESVPPATDQLRAYLRHARAATPADIAPFVAWLCSPAATGITGQVFGARGAELTVWSQPRPAATVVDTSGWDAASLDAVARPALEPHLVPLESEFDLFGGPPVAVERPPGDER